MTKAILNPKVDFYFKAGKWQKEINLLRMIVLGCGLTEVLKWGCPCYTLPASSGKDKNNIVLIHVFKDYCGVLFFKGALLKDPKHILVQQTKNVQAARQARFTNVSEVIKKEPALKACIKEAIAVEKAGLKVELKKPGEFTIVEEFKKKISGKGGAALKAAFDALTPGRQRGYYLYFSAPKQSKTREARIEKSIALIFKGKGLND